MSGQEVATVCSAAPRFGKNGRILSGRVREDGHVWCPGCQDFHPPTRFARSKTVGQSGYGSRCYACHHRQREKRFIRNPDEYARQLARQRAFRRRVQSPRGDAVHREYLGMAHVALARLHAIGLRSGEIARLCEVSKRSLYDLRKPHHRAKRPTMDKVLALLRVAGDIPAGINRATYYGRHEFYAVLARRMAEPLREIAEAREQGKYRTAMGARAE